MPINWVAEGPDATRQAELRARGTANARPTAQARGLSGLNPVPDESALEKYARKRNAALDFVPQYGNPQSTPKPVPDESALERWAKKRGAALDFVPQYGGPQSATSTSRPTPSERGLANATPPVDSAAKPRTKTEHSRSSVEAVQTDPMLTAQVTSGPGYVFVGSKGQDRCHPVTKQVIEVVGQKWAELHPGGPRMRIGAIGVVGGGPLVRGHDKFGAPLFHKSHQLGVDLDIHLMRNDNTESSTDIGLPTYSRELTQQLIELFQSQSVLRVDYIFFNDPKIPGVKYQDGHSNHFHVRFLRPTR